MFNDFIDLFKCYTLKKMHINYLLVPDKITNISKSENTFLSQDMDMGNQNIFSDLQSNYSGSLSS